MKKTFLIPIFFLIVVFNLTWSNGTVTIKKAEAGLFGFDSVGDMFDGGGPGNSDPGNFSTVNTSDGNGGNYVGNLMPGSTLGGGNNGVNVPNSAFNATISNVTRGTYVTTVTQNGVEYEIRNVAAPNTPGTPPSRPQYEAVRTQSDGGGGNGGGGTTVVLPIDREPWGEIDSLYVNPSERCSQIVGWACDRDARNQPVEIKLFIDNQLVTTFDTSVVRPDVLANGICGSGRADALWGYRYVVPEIYKDGVARTVKIYAVNQGVLGSSTETQLPHTTWSSPRTLPLQCPLPRMAHNLAVSLDNPGDQIEGVAFDVSPLITNLGNRVTSSTFPVLLLVDKKVASSGSSWVYEGSGVNGDLRLRTVIPAGLASQATTTAEFNGLVLPAGEYRIRAEADPGRVVESASSSQLANNSTNWEYFTVTASVPAPDLSFTQFNISGKCTVSQMTVGNRCPQTTVDFRLQNLGTRAIAPGVNIPYLVEYLLPGDDPAGVWRRTAVNNYTLGLAIGAQTALLQDTVPNLPLGTSTLRMVTNPLPGTRALGEADFSNNTSNFAQVDYTSINSDLAIKNFAVSRACTPAEYSGGSCPATQVTFVLENIGARGIAASTPVAYVVQTRSNNGVWNNAVRGTYARAILANGGVSQNIVADVLDLPVGTTQIRVVVNPVPRDPLLREVNYANNVSLPIRQVYQLNASPIDLPTFNLTATPNTVRKLNRSTISWEFSDPILATHTCTLSGPGVSTRVTSQIGKFTTLPIGNTTVYTMSCTDGTTTNSDSVTIEIVPPVQEV